MYDLLRDAPEPYTQWEHYPADDVEDPESGCAWYYHAHAPSPSRRWTEHGHFHCFVHARKVAAHARPVAVPAVIDTDRTPVSHLVALSCDHRGVPVRLFTINRWASNEWMYAADDLVSCIDTFELSNIDRYALTSRWLGATLRVMRPQVAWLLAERDRVLAAHRTQTGNEAFDDDTIDVTSTLTFDIDAQLAAIEDAWHAACGDA